ncbi:hypothetical protein [Microbacterium sp.]|uniref:hypothetical protein n=1 Tax=Microbacterium sp. TaxID=51671 RepID=UPI002811BEEF|nr:hypothetical protein [Microbacterium sp.]
MSISLTHAEPPSTGTRLNRVRNRTGQALLTAVFALCGVIAISTAFADDPFEASAVVLIASFGTLAAVLGVAAVWGGMHSRAVRVALWALPLFFVWHVAALGTWLPDAILGIVSAVGILLLTPSRR